MGWILRILLLVGVGFATLMVVARFSDGPIGIIAGGELIGGELNAEEPDWSFVRSIDTVEFQLLEPPRSRTTWILEHEGKIYIPCGYMDTSWGRLWKKWPIEAEADGRAVLRVNGVRYRRQLVRVKSGPVVEVLVAQISDKYSVPASAEAVANDSLWLFELQPAQQLGLLDD